MPRNQAKLKIVRIGQGDCILITAPSGKLILVDAGTKGGVSAAMQYSIDDVRKALWGRSLRPARAIDVLVMTHHDADHYNKIGDLIGGQTIKKLYYSGNLSNYYTYAFNYWWWKQGHVVKTESITVDRANPVPKNIFKEKTSGGEEFRLDVLASNYVVSGGSIDAMDSVSINTRSIVIKGSYNDQSFLLTGDATAQTEAFMLGVNAANLKANVVKIGHHGSGESSTQAFVNAVAPNEAIVSCRPQGTRFKHPRADVVDRWSRKVDTFSIPSHSFAYWGLNNQTLMWEYSILNNLTRALWETGLNGSIEYVFPETGPMYRIDDPTIYPDNAYDPADEGDDPDDDHYFDSGDESGMSDDD